jgi:Bifunctional DNA primase/polymerase, N-terminal
MTKYVQRRPVLDVEDSPPSMVEMALQYADWNWPVVPLHYPVVKGSGLICSCRDADCVSPAQHLMTAGGLKDATVEQWRVKRWWKAWPDANIGIATGCHRSREMDSNVLNVFEVNGVEGRASFRELLDLGFAWPTRYGRVRTGRQNPGWNIYVWSLPARNRPAFSGETRTEIAASLSWQGEGGYVVAPPSLDISGARYRWLEGPFSTPRYGCPSRGFYNEVDKLGRTQRRLRKQSQRELRNRGT